jgi:hypothetical protein
MFSAGSNSRSAAATVKPPMPLSKTPIGAGGGEAGLARLFADRMRSDGRAADFPRAGILNWQSTS